MPPCLPRPRYRPSLVHRSSPLIALVLAIAAPLPAQAQEMGSLQGTVRDAAGAPVPTAIVEAQLEGAEFRRGTAADAAGRYRLTGLPAGRYRVRVRHPGFATVDQSIPVAAGEAAGQDFVLRIRAVVIDTVTVTPDNPAVINREHMEFATQVSEAAMRLLPLRPEVKEVVALTPGARAEQVWGGATQQANNYQIDGLAANHPGLGGDLVQPSINWIEAVEVRGLGAGAEAGNFQGGLVNLVTKSGSNEFEGAVRVNVESGALSASNLQAYDVATETDSRYDLEAEARGPVVRDRLHYYLAGQLVQRADNVVNHLRTREGFFAPDGIDRQERKLFGKLSWRPDAASSLVVSGGYIGLDIDRIGATGYEDRAFLRSTAPTWFYNGTFRRVLAPGALLDLSLGGFTRDERREPYEDASVPAVMLAGQGERPTYNTAPFRYRLAPSVATGTATVQWEARTGPLTHNLKVGGELSRGDWNFDRLRNGGMTWRPGFGRYYDSFDPANTATWRGPLAFVPMSVGGEVRLDADAWNGAAFIQDHIDVGSRFSISPGVRFGWWSGYITPAGDVGPRFRAVDDRAWDGRLGVTLDLTGRNDLVLKAHAGRYHQSLFAQLYDRAEGGNVFSNEQLWNYFGTPDRPDRTFTPVEQDALAAQGRLQLREEVRLNQTGPTVNYRQPYIDQLVVGLEKQLGRWLKAELVYVNRRNGNMVALVDRNLATNYTLFENIQALDAAGDPLWIDGEPLVLERVYIPNFILVDHLKLIAQGYGGPNGLPRPPGMTLADTIALSWDPDYVLTNVPAARRTFQQAQLVVRMGHPRHGGTASLVYTRLRGNLDNVSGYDEGSSFAGPFVNPNQSVNSYGRLNNSSEWELKLWVYGALRWGFRGGIFWLQTRGDRYTPVYTLSTFFTYADSAGAALPQRLVAPVAGQPLLLRQRGSEEYPYRSLVDVHLERAVRFRGAEWLMTIDAFNVLGTTTPTRYNTSVNDIPIGNAIGTGAEPEAAYAAVRERVRPRSVRLGTTVRF